MAARSNSTGILVLKTQQFPSKSATIGATIRGLIRNVCPVVSFGYAAMKPYLCNVGARL